MKTRYLVGTFHTKNTTINGLSIGAYSLSSGEKRYVKTNGIRLEVPGIGLIGFLANADLAPDIATNNDFNKNNLYRFSEVINGINISTGSFGEINYNGITIGLVTQSGVLSNGIALTGLWSGLDISNGIAISGMFNQATYNNGIQLSLVWCKSKLTNGIQISAMNNAYKLNGIQIGLFNKSSKTNGIQIGLWNVNEKRKLPLLNWNFKE